MRILVATISLLAAIGHVTCQFGGPLTDGCGFGTKGCSRFPDACTGDACDFVFTWSLPDARATKMAFQIEAKTDGWVAVGLSKDQKMGDTSIMECKVQTDGTVAIGLSYNEGYMPTDISPYTTGISDAFGSYRDGVLKCSFKRDLVIADSKVFDLAGKYYLLLGTGAMWNGGNNKGKHATIPIISSAMTDVTTDLSDGGTGQVVSNLVKAHGILMITAWTICVCTAVLLARFYKGGWPEKLLCDKKPVWFSVHRVLNTTVFVLTIIAFIIIFVEIQGFSTGSIIHPIFGIIVTVLCTINPLMALFRPAPDAKRRPIFNWAHWGVGTLAQVCAGVTMFLGMLTPKAAFVPEHCRWLLLTFIIFHIIIDITLEIHKCTLDSKQEKEKGEVEMKEAGADNKDAKPQNSGLFFKYIVFYIYIGVSVGLYLAIMISIAMG